MPKKPGKPAAKVAPAKPRRIKLGTYKSFHLQKRIKHPVKLPSVWWLTKQASLLLWKHKTLFLSLTLIYGFVNLSLAQSFAGGTDVSTLKDAFSRVFTGQLGFLPTGLSIFAVLVSTAGNTSSQTGTAYQIFLAVISSLAIIWALRQVVAGRHPAVKHAFYRGMTPLVPFILILLLIGLQLLPLIIGSGLYSLVINNGIAVYTIEKITWGLLFASLALLSLYMITSSLFALYIVTLPDMTPMKALRSARTLVRYRRWVVLRKLLCLPIILLVAGAIVMLPIITFITPLAQWTFFLLTMASLIAIHAYIYTLYRELLNE